MLTATTLITSSERSGVLQCRGGCLCAGPYAMSLLGISLSQSRSLEAQLLEKDEMVRARLPLTVAHAHL